MFYPLTWIVLGAIFWYISDAAHWLAYISWGISAILFIVNCYLSGKENDYYGNYSGYYSHTTPKEEPKVCTDYKLRAVEWQKSKEDKDNEKT